MNHTILSLSKIPLFSYLMGSSQRYGIKVIYNITFVSAEVPSPFVFFATMYTENGHGVGLEK